MSDTNTITLLTAASTTGAAQQWSGGEGLWAVWGTWGGATAQLDYSPDDGANWIPIVGGSFTEDGGEMAVRVPPSLLRVSITNATTTSLSSNMKRSD